MGHIIWSIENWSYHNRMLHHESIVCLIEFVRVKIHLPTDVSIPVQYDVKEISRTYLPRLCPNPIFYSVHRFNPVFRGYSRIRLDKPGPRKTFTVALYINLLSILYTLYMLYYFYIFSGWESQGGIYRMSYSRLTMACNSSSVTASNKFDEISRMFSGYSSQVL